MEKVIKDLIKERKNKEKETENFVYNEVEKMFKKQLLSNKNNGLIEGISTNDILIKNLISFYKN